MLDKRTQIQLINTPLSIRPKLTIPAEARFGLEIELENVDLKQVNNLVNTQFGSNWKVKDDRSLLKNQNAEIATPVLTNSLSTWEILKKLSELIIRLDPTFANCSFQINFDGSLLPTIEDRINLLKLYAYYEDIICRFSKGEDQNYRESINIYASPIILILKDALQTLKNNKKLIIEEFTNRKDVGITFKKQKKDIIEYRTPNGTANLILWQNYITFFYYFIKLVRSKKYNLREIDEYIDSYSQIQILQEYEKINEEKALTLSKKAFINQKDHIYFLQQYIGNR